jgi:PqqD family protein of HPr-rel-A system
MSRRPKLRPELLTREVADEFLVYEPESGEVYLMNPTAASIIELCDGSRDAEAIAAVILEAVAADPDTVKADVERTLADLDEKKLLQWSEGE